MAPSDTENVDNCECSSRESCEFVPGIETGAELGSGDARLLCKVAEDVARRRIFPAWA